MTESELSVEQKSKLAANFIVQAPPGEVNDVINDIRSIIADDAALMPYVVPALRTYNLTQLHVVEHPATEEAPAHTSLLTSAAILPGGGDERYVDVEGQRSFAFDHVTLAISDYQPYTLPEGEASFLAELSKSLSAYTKNHFPSGHSSVSCSQFPLLPQAPVPEVQVNSANEKSVTALSSSDDQTSASELLAENVITDVVPEQVGSGSGEPAPTPAIGELKVPSEGHEVVGESVLEAVDEKVEEAKEEVAVEKRDIGEDELEPTGGDSKVETVEPVKESTNKVDIPVEEVDASKDVKEGSVSTAAVVEERKQEKIENPVFTLQLVGNRYNPSNFWTGRWRSEWIVDQAAGKVDGTIKVDVHYYEQGNVQLAANHSASFPCPKEAIGNQSIASQIVTTISKIETNYHLELNDVYGDLGDKAFRALRRALPITRQKMEWQQVSGYSLGSELTKARA